MLIEINSQTINKLLTALNECTEWGQVFILDALSSYQPKDEREAQKFAILLLTPLLDRMTPLTTREKFLSCWVWCRV